MKKVFSIFLILVVMYSNVKGQNNYEQWVASADSLYQVKNYSGSAKAYSNAFQANNWKGTSNDRYNAACSWALAGVKDSAFFQLFRIAEKMDYSNYAHLTSDTDLASIQDDERWLQLTELVKANKKRKEANRIEPVATELEAIYKSDQGTRQQISVIESKYGRGSEQMTALWREMAYQDSVNLVKVTAILDKYGWLGPDEAGQEGNNAIFLVIQHSNLEMMKKYLPMMREAVKNGKAQASALALLEDRTRVNQGMKQLYGSQLKFNENTQSYELDPIEDPMNVDARRAAMGLGPLSNYIARWGLQWNPEEHIKLNGN